MSRPSIRRSKYRREKDLTLTWLIEWLKDVHASMGIMETMVNKSVDLKKYTPQFVAITDAVEKLIGEFEEEPA